jgi:2-keto-4-pentenoate hydratase/2-oxohepta-3-ene-1,7-dioic acid hydratase in catechol pathway
MKLYLGLLESSLPHQTRIFGEVDGKLVDLCIAYATYLADVELNHSSAYELAEFYFPETIGAFLERGEQALVALTEVLSFARKSGIQELRGPAGEKVVYDAREIRLLPPFQNPQKSIVIGLAEKARIEAVPKAEIPTGVYKLPQTFVTNGAPIVWPKFSEELDADACLALVIGKAGRRIPPEQAWDHLAGITLLIDITARDINKREGLTTNNLLGKNFPASTSIGPSLLLKPARTELESMAVALSIDGSIKQQFALRECVFTIEQIIARWSILGIQPGDFLAIGASMALQDERLQNPVPLKIGSTVRCSSPALGELSHGVVLSGEAHR